MIKSILIKGMEMPKTCFDCPLSYDFYICNLNSKSFYGADAPADFDPSTARLPTCQLEETNYID